MRFQFVLFVLTVLVVRPFGSIAQCPYLDLQLQDTLCANEDFDLSNLDSSFSSYTWTFGINDFSGLPTVNDLGNPGSSLSNQTYGIRIVKEDSVYYGFVKKSNPKNVYRYDFGTSLNNTPTVTALTMNAFSGETSLSDDDIDIVYINGNWYGFAPIRTGNAIIRYSFGTTLANNTITATNIGNPAAQLALPTVLKVDYYRDSLYITVANFNSSSFTVCNFGTNPTNGTPIWFKTQSTAASPTVTQITALETYFNCDKFVVFVAGLATSNLVRYNFHHSVFSTPSITQIGSNVYPSPYSAKLIDDHGKPELYMKCRTTAKNIYRISFADSVQESVSAITAAEFNENANSMAGMALSVVYTEDGLYFFNVINSGQLRKVRVPYQTGLQHNRSYEMIPPALGAQTESVYSYGLTAIDSAGNRYYYSDSFYAAQSPQVSHAINGFCFGIGTEFSAYSLDTTQALSWLWNFGDGDTALTPDPQHLYTDTGSYSVQLTASNGMCNLVLDTQIFIYPIPVAAFSVDSTCIGNSTPLQNASTFYSGDSIVQFLWASAEDTLAGENQSVVYDSAGIFQVYLFIQTQNGCRDTAIDMISVKPAALSSFIASHTCAGDTVQFLNSTNYGGTFISAWDFDSLGTSGQESTSFVFPDTGNYTVSLEVTSDNGCVNESETIVRISPVPTIGLTYNSGPYCRESTLFVTDLSASIDPIVQTIMAIPGDTQFNFQGEFILHTFGTQSLYYQIHVGTDCTRDTIFNLYINDKPEAWFVLTDSCNQEVTDLITVSTVQDQQQIGIAHWLLNDTSALVGDTLQLPLSDDADSLKVRLEVVTDSGCAATAERTVELFLAPRIQLDLAVPLCSDLDLNSGTELDADVNDSIIETRWVFTDALDSFVIVNEERVVIPAAGNVALRLSAHSVKGCRSLLDTLLMVQLSPTLDLHHDTVCAASLIEVASTYSGTNYSYSWLSSDGVTSISDTFTHIFNDPGQQWIMHALTDNATQCYDTMTIRLLAAQPVSATVDASGLCQSSIAEFRPTVNVDSFDSIRVWQWSLNNMVVSTSELLKSLLLERGLIQVRLDLESAAGCAFTVANFYTVKEEISSAFESSAAFGNAPLEVGFSSDKAYLSNWFVNDTLVSDAASFDYVFEAAGVYEVKHLAIDTGGCRSSSARKITVYDGFTDLQIDRVEALQNEAITQFQFYVSNVGQTRVEGFYVRLNSSKGMSIVETFSDTLEIGELKSVRFQAQAYDLDPDQQVCVELIGVNQFEDSNPDNNRSCTLLDDQFVPPPYPNPARSETSVSVYVNSEQIVKTNILTMVGQVIYEWNVSVTSGYNELKFPLNSLPQGQYVITITTDKATYSHLLTKL